MIIDVHKVTQEAQYVLNNGFPLYHVFIRSYRIIKYSLSVSVCDGFCIWNQNNLYFISPPCDFTVENWNDEITVQQSIFITDSSKFNFRGYIILYNVGIPKAQQCHELGANIMQGT